MNQGKPIVENAVVPPGVEIPAATEIAGLGTLRPMTPEEKEASHRDWVEHRRFERLTYLAGKFTAAILSRGENVKLATKQGWAAAEEFQKFADQKAAEAGVKEDYGW